ncbi:ser threonine protein phosphatase, partial [Lasius niger]
MAQLPAVNTQLVGAPSLWAGAGGFAVEGANLHQREQRRIFGDRRVYHPFVIRQMAAEQRAVDFTDGALAELPAERGIDGLIAGHHHQPGRAEIQAVRQ